MEQKEFKLPSLNIPLLMIGFVFLMLKLNHVVDWPWFWILFPFGLGIVFFIVALAIVGFAYLIINHPKVQLKIKEQQEKSK